MRSVTEEMVKASNKQSEMQMSPQKVSKKQRVAQSGYALFSKEWYVDHADEDPGDKPARMRVDWQNLSEAEQQEYKDRAGQKKIAKKI